MKRIAISGLRAATVMAMSAVVLALTACAHGTSKSTAPRSAARPSNAFLGKWGNKTRTVGFEFMDNGTGNVDAMVQFSGETRGSFTYTMRDSRTASLPTFGDRSAP